MFRFPMHGLSVILIDYALVLAKNMDEYGKVCV